MHGDVPRTDPVSELCAHVRELFGAHGCVCARLLQGGDLEFVAGAGPSWGPMLGTRLAAGTGLTGYVARTGMPLEVVDVPHDVRFASDQTRAAQVSSGYVPTWFLGVPLLDGGDDVVGVLSVVDPDPDIVRELTAGAGSALPALVIVASEVARLFVDGHAQSARRTGSTTGAQASSALDPAEA